MPPPSFGKKNKKNKPYDVPLHAADPDKAFTYINLTILDASEAVRSMVQQKVEEKQMNKPGPAFLKKKVAAKVADVAASKVPPSAIVKKLSEKLPKTLMYQMYHKMGMRLAAQTVFIEDSFAVIQIQVQYVDSRKLVAQAAEEKKNDGDDDDDDSVATAVIDEWLKEQANQPTDPGERVPSVTATTTLKEGPQNWKESLAYLLEWIISKLLPDHAVRSLEHDRLPALIQSNLAKNMQGMMSKKLADKKLEADIAVLDSTVQAPYFFSNLQAVRERAHSKTK